MASRKKVEPVAEATGAESAAKKEAKPFDLFLDHQKQAFHSASKALRSLVPDDARQHGRKAVEEALEGYRTLFNSAIDEMISTVRSTREDVNQFVDKVEEKVKSEKK